jgi:hypothetical protein
MNNGPHWRAAELHDLAAHAHRTAATHQENSGHEHSKQAMEHSARAHRYSQEAHQESESSVKETGKSVRSAHDPTEQTSARPKAPTRRPGKWASKANRVAKVVNKKVASRKAFAKKRAAPKKADGAKQARIEIEFIGPAEELGKVLFDLFQTHELKTGHVREIAPDAKIELLPGRMVKGAPSVVILLTIGLAVPESVASNYLWHKCGKFTKSREVKILVNQAEYVSNEHELKKIIKTTIEKETEEK